MKKLLNNPWVSGTLALLAILFVANSVMENMNFSPAYSYPDITSEDENSDSDETLNTDPAPTKFDLASIQSLASQTTSRNLFQRKKDIIAPVKAESEKQVMAEATIRVKGIWIQNNIRYVIIDDQMLQSGQSIERVRVERIDEQGVWVTANQDNATLEPQFVQPGQSWTYQYPKPNDNSHN